jgi:hypothetical protein
VKEQIELTNTASQWLARAGVVDPDLRATLAVGLADSVHAMEVSLAEIEGMLSTDPTTEAGADQALTHCGVLGAYFFNELKWHLEDMASVWESALEGRLAERLPPDQDEL